VLTADDCDDTDASVGLPDVDDPDCDGVPTHAGGGAMILVPAGSFDMGCTPGQSDCGSYESPVMPVTLTHDYYMGETEVTQAAYEAVMGTNPSYFTDCGNDCPVEMVNWHMAAAYANALSSSAGLTECYTCSGSGDSVDCGVAMSPYACDGYRLPTEAEWEGAARCGEDLRYAGSNDIDAVGWTIENSDRTTHAVAGKDANACGLYDMSGNVWEWTQDWHSPDYYYTADGRTDPEGASEGYAWIRRGGCEDYLTDGARVAFRSNMYGSHSGTGFRLARTLP
jgi:formylglycine-generating enzyme required for sulfatase activity